MARSNNSATREFYHVILSEAKDLGKLGRFFAALRMTDGALRCSSFGAGHTRPAVPAQMLAGYPNSGP
jgi:hypothetical protein